MSRIEHDYDDEPITTDQDSMVSQQSFLKRSHTFSVRVDVMTAVDRVYVIGSVSEIGLWQYKDALCLNLLSKCEKSSTSSKYINSVWQRDVLIPSENIISYRYFIGKPVSLLFQSPSLCVKHVTSSENSNASTKEDDSDVDEPCAEDSSNASALNCSQCKCEDSQLINPHTRPHSTKPPDDLLITSWESSLVPRKTNPAMIDLEQESTSTYGYYNGKLSLDQGWLTQQKNVNLLVKAGDIVFWRQVHKNNPSIRVKVLLIDIRKSLKKFNEMIQVCNTNHSESAYQIEYVNLKNDVVCENASFAFQPFFGVQFDSENNLLYRVQLLNLEKYISSALLGLKWVKQKHVSIRYAYLFFFYKQKKESVVENALGSTPADPYQVFAFSYIMPLSANASEWLSKKTYPIISVKYQMPIGNIHVSTCVSVPLQSHNFFMKTSYSTRLNTPSNKTLVVGHRGLGSSYQSKAIKLASLRENTIASFKEAAKCGADYIEFDVQLSKDLVPVIYHDFYVCLSLKKKKSSPTSSPVRQNEFAEDEDLFQFAIKDLPADHLQSLKLHHQSIMSSTSTNNFSTLNISKSDECEDLLPFPRLSEVLCKITPDIGFNIEIKYPQVLSRKVENLEEEPKHYFEVNLFVDKILKSLLDHVANRRIIISSFHPDICVLVRLKQNIFPVILLIESEGYYDDPRTKTFLSSLTFAAAMKFLGLSINAALILQHPEFVKIAKEHSLVVFVYGDVLVDKQIRDKMRKYGVDAIIYDRVSESQIGPNIFEVAREEKNKLFKYSSVIKRVSSGEHLNVIGGQKFKTFMNGEFH